MEPESEPGVERGQDSEWDRRGLRTELRVLFGRSWLREWDLSGRLPPLQLLQAILRLMQDRCGRLSTKRPPRQGRPLSTWAVAAWTWCSSTPGEAPPISLLDILLTTLRIWQREGISECGRDVLASLAPPPPVGQMVNPRMVMPLLQYWRSLVPVRGLNAKRMRVAWGLQWVLGALLGYLLPVGPARFAGGPRAVSRRPGQTRVNQWGHVAELLGLVFELFGWWIAMAPTSSGIQLLRLPRL